jgi:hypothetical protein
VNQGIPYRNSHTISISSSSKRTSIAHPAFPPWDPFPLWQARYAKYSSGVREVELLCSNYIQLCIFITLDCSSDPRQELDSWLRHAGRIPLIITVVLNSVNGIPERIIKRLREEGRQFKALAFRFGPEKKPLQSPLEAVKHRYTSVPTARNLHGCESLQELYIDHEEGGRTFYSGSVFECHLPNLLTMRLRRYSRQ